MTKTVLQLLDSLRITRRAGLAALLAATAATFVSTLPVPASAEDKTSVKVGIMSGEDEDVWRVVVGEAAKLGLTVEPVVFDTYDDHRMAMSLALIGLHRPNVSIRNPACVAKTYPWFWRDLARVYDELKK